MKTQNQELQALRAVRSAAKSLRLCPVVDDDFPELMNNLDRAIYLAESHIDTPSFDAKTCEWLVECFGPEIAMDIIERNHRFLEESLELVQACGCSRSEAHQLVDYVFGRAVGNKNQEVGGVMITLRALCFAQCIDAEEQGYIELERISDPDTMAAIRTKQANKPKMSPLPERPISQALADIKAERIRQIDKEGFTPVHDDYYDNGELATAAVAYAALAGRALRDTTGPTKYKRGTAPIIWPWADGWFKPTTPRRDLVKAGALIVAEIERMDRAAKS